MACAATGLVGKESDLFRLHLATSLIFATIVGLITLAQAYWFTGMLGAFRNHSERIDAGQPAAFGNSTTRSAGCCLVASRRAT